MTAAVTGASSGIGATFARQLAADGYDLVLIARRADRLDELAAELRSRHHVGVETIAADLTNDADVGAVARRISDTDDLDLLVNNAGFGTKGYFFETDAAAQEQMHRLHVLATERLTRAALPGMVARRRGGIINVSSIAGFMQGPKNVSYCATKAWMNSFTEGLWMELKSARSPVVVQALCPGYTNSEFHDVANVKRDTVPKTWWMPADFVVRESLRGLKRGKLYVVPGVRYRLIVATLKVLPRSLLRTVVPRFRTR